MGHLVPKRWSWLQIEKVVDLACEWRGEYGLKLCLEIRKQAADRKILFGSIWASLGWVMTGKLQHMPKTWLKLWDKQVRRRYKVSLEKTRQAKRNNLLMTVGHESREIKQYRRSAAR